jgi:predicted GNAT superfamily acetyltransferase
MNIFDNLEKTFDIATIKDAEVVSENIPKELVIIEEGSPAEEDSKDKKIARDTYKSLIEKSDKMLDDMMKIAEATEHPRAFEVAAGIIKTMTDVASKLEESASKVETKSKGSQSPGNVSNNIFVGSSEELMNLIRQK